MNDMILELDNLSKSYRQGEADIHVLQGLSFTLRRGDVAAIVGQSGSGKSTLLSLLSGIDRPSSGSIRFQGRALENMSEKELTAIRSRDIGIVFQQFHLMPNLTALENIMLPLEIIGHEAAEGRAREALSLVGLAERATHLPYQLSGGEKQRVAIARAFVTGPALLLADEPSGNLDQETGDRVMSLLFDTVARLKMTMILVTHDPNLAQRCQTQWRLHKGVLSQQLPAGTSL